MGGCLEHRPQRHSADLRQGTVDQTSQWLSSVNMRLQAAIHGQGLRYAAHPSREPVHAVTLSIPDVDPAFSFQGGGHSHLAINAAQDVAVLSKHLPGDPWSLQKVCCFASCLLCWSRQAALPLITHCFQTDHPRHLLSLVHPLKIILISTPTAVFWRARVGTQFYCLIRTALPRVFGNLQGWKACTGSAKAFQWNVWLRN